MIYTLNTLQFWSLRENEDLKAPVKLGPEQGLFSEQLLLSPLPMYEHVRQQLKEKSAFHLLDNTCRISHIMLQNVSVTLVGRLGFAWITFFVLYEDQLLRSTYPIERSTYISVFHCTTGYSKYYC